MRTMLKNGFGIDADGPIGARVRSAKLINTWRTVRERIKKQAELDDQRKCRASRSFLLAVV